MDEILLKHAIRGRERALNQALSRDGSQTTLKAKRKTLESVAAGVGNRYFGRTSI